VPLTTSYRRIDQPIFRAPELVSLGANDVSTPRAKRIHHPPGTACRAWESPVPARVRGQAQLFAIRSATNFSCTRPQGFRDAKPVLQACPNPDTRAGRSWPRKGISWPSRRLSEPLHHSQPRMQRVNFWARLLAFAISASPLWAIANAATTHSAYTNPPSRSHATPWSNDLRGGRRGQGEKHRWLGH